MRTQIVQQHLKSGVAKKKRNKCRRRRRLRAAQSWPPVSIKVQAVLARAISAQRLVERRRNTRQSAPPKCQLHPIPSSISATVFVYSVPPARAARAGAHPRLDRLERQSHVTGERACLEANAAFCRHTHRQRRVTPGSASPDLLKHTLTRQLDGEVQPCAIAMSFLQRLSAIPFLSISRPL